MREVMAGAGALEGCVGCMWDGEGPGHIQRNGAHPGWSWGDSSHVAVCGAVRLDMGVAKTHGWGQDTCA